MTEPPAAGGEEEEHGSVVVCQHNDTLIQMSRKCLMFVHPFSINSRFVGGKPSRRCFAYLHNETLIPIVGYL